MSHRKIRARMTKTKLSKALIALFIFISASIQGCGERPKAQKIGSETSAQRAVNEDLSGVDARKTAMQAYRILMENSFNREKMQEAYAMLLRAEKKDPREPWVYITASEMVLNNGFKIGSRYDMESYQKGTVDKAIRLAQRGLELGPDLSRTHAQLGKTLIINQEYEKAQKHLDKAQELDQSEFYPSFYKGVLYEKRREFKRSKSYFKEAEARIQFDSQYYVINLHLQNIAALTRDFAEEERLLKENIARRPDYPYFYSHYAFFLKRHGRLDEAIKNWEKAVELGPYPNAVRQLEIAKKLKATME